MECYSSLKRGARCLAACLHSVVSRPLWIGTDEGAGFGRADRGDEVGLSGSGTDAGTRNRRQGQQGRIEVV